jgi:hypothetical protein
MSNTVTNIATGLNKDKAYTGQLSDKAKGKLLEKKLTTICNTLAEVGNLTSNKADLEFLLMVVGSYLISRKDGTLAIGADEPSILFTNSLLPALDNMEEVVVEEIEDGD